MLATACSEPRGPYAATGHAVGQPEHREGLDPAGDGAVGDSERRRIRRMRVDHAADVGAVVVHGRMHRHDRALDRGQLALQERPVQRDRAMPSGCSPFSDEADVKYISSAPGTRKADVAVPLAEMAPPASTFAAVSEHLSTRFLSIDVFSR